ncbi:MAG: LemA family protein [Bacteroidales bacterium]
MQLLLALLAILLLWALIQYNRLIRRRNETDQSFSTIDVMLKQRFDMIPNLLAVVKKYAAYESATLEEITRLRSKQFGTLSNEEKENFDRQFSGMTQKLQVVAEKYPDLKASDQFLQLQRAITEMEEQLSAARRTYNASVTEYNHAVMMFPGSLIASLFGFKPRTWFRFVTPAPTSASASASAS